MVVDRTPPRFTVEVPTDGHVTDQALIVVTGTLAAEPVAAVLTVNERDVRPSEHGRYAVEWDLAFGRND